MPHARPSMDSRRARGAREGSSPPRIASPPSGRLAPRSANRRTADRRPAGTADVPRTPPRIPCAASGASPVRNPSTTHRATTSIRPIEASVAGSNKSARDVLSMIGGWRLVGQGLQVRRRDSGRDVQATVFRGRDRETRNVDVARPSTPPRMSRRRILRSPASALPARGRRPYDLFANHLSPTTSPRGCPL